VLQSIAGYAAVLKGGTYSYGNTQIPIAPTSAAALSLNMARDAIQDDHLEGAGKDVDPNHVTVRYGLLNENLDALRAFLASQKPFEARVEGVELFPASEHSDGAVPVVARIVSPELHAIEAEIGNYADFKEKSFPVYKPHCTLAYCKPEIAERYQELFVYGSFVVQSITISHASGVQETIPFGITNKFDVTKKDPVSGRYVTPFVSFDKQGDEQLRMITSLNASRLATWGFTAEAEVLGMARYRLTAVLDGRTSKFCRMIDGHIFDVADAREKVIEALNVQDPNDLRVVQPWPKQDKASMAMYSEMNAQELTDRGLHIPPYHPHCRTLCRSVESSKGKTTEVTATVPDGTEVFQPVTAADLAEIGVTATPEQVAEWNANIGMSPVELMTKLTGGRPQEVMTRGVGSKPVEFHPSGDIGLNARGVTDGVEFKLGAILDPFTGIFYLTRAELAEGTPKAEAAFLKRMFSAMLDMGKKSTASSIALSVAGNAAYYAKLGFLPDELEWDALRTYSLGELEAGVLQPMMASLAPADALLVKQLLQDGSPSALVALTELPFTYAGKTIGEWILSESSGIWALDLADDLMVAQAKAYLS
jgi:2'-5' RNA ligase